MINKLSFILQLIFVSIVVWLLTTLLFTNEIVFNNSESETTQVDSLSDGVFYGFAQGHNDVLEVEVTVENEEITQVIVSDHAESDGISDPAIEQIPTQIVESNSTAVDIISGATFTSEAIINAVNNALSEDYPDPSDGDTTNGIYTGSAEGHNDTLTVEVTMENGVISNVEVTDHSETDGLSDPAIEQIPEQIVETNSVDVEIVSGASFTSEAIIEAVKDAIAQN